MKHGLMYNTKYCFSWTVEYLLEAKAKDSIMPGGILDNIPFVLSRTIRR